MVSFQMINVALNNCVVAAVQHWCEGLETYSRWSFYDIVARFHVYKLLCLFIVTQALGCGFFTLQWTACGNHTQDIMRPKTKWAFLWTVDYLLLRISIVNEIVKGHRLNSPVWLIALHYWEHVVRCQQSLPMSIIKVVHRMNVTDSGEFLISPSFSICNSI